MVSRVFRCSRFKADIVSEIEELVGKASSANLEPARGPNPQAFPGYHDDAPQHPKQVYAEFAATGGRGGYGQGIGV